MSPGVLQSYVLGKGDISNSGHWGPPFLHQFGVWPQQDKSDQVQVHSAASLNEKDIARAQSSRLGCASGQDGLPPRDHRCASILSLHWGLGASSHGRGAARGISSPAQ